MTGSMPTSGQKKTPPEFPPTGLGDLSPRLRADEFLHHVAGGVGILDFIPVAGGTDDLNRRGIFQLSDPVRIDIRANPHVDLLAVIAVNLRGEGPERALRYGSGLVRLQELGLHKAFPAAAGHLRPSIADITKDAYLRTVLKAEQTISIQGRLFPNIQPLSIRTVDIH